MRVYEAKKITGSPDWTTVAVAPIDNQQWAHADGITPSAQLCWDDDALYVRLQTLEEHILRRYTGITDPVWDDSCLEFFFRVEPEGNRYFNFECNPNGAMYIGFGKPGTERCRLLQENFPECFGVKTFDIPGGWGLELRIPVSFIQIFVPDFTPCAGKTIYGNFYKCGDETPVPHFMSWNPLGNPEPNFHRPEYFGTIHLV